MVACCHCHACTDSIAIAFCTAEPNFDASVASVDVVLEEGVAGVVDDVDIDVAIVIKIASSRAASNDIDSNVECIGLVNEVSVLVVIETVAIGFLGIVNITVDDVKITPTIVVIVNETGVPSDAFVCDTDGFSNIGESTVTVIAPEEIGIIIRDKEIQICVVIVVPDTEPHCACRFSVNFRHDTGLL